MGKRYIDADALIEDLEYDINLAERVLDSLEADRKERDVVGFDISCKLNAIEFIKDTPAADVRENVKAHWSYTDDLYETPFCSNCGWESLDYIEFKFCPNCGADMRGVT